MRVEYHRGRGTRTHCTGDDAPPGRSQGPLAGYLGRPTGAPASPLQPCARTFGRKRKKKLPCRPLAPREAFRRGKHPEGERCNAAKGKTASAKKAGQDPRAGTRGGQEEDRRARRARLYHARPKKKPPQPKLPRRGPPPDVHRRRRAASPVSTGVGQVRRPQAARTFRAR